MYGILYTLYYIMYTICYILGTICYILHIVYISNENAATYTLILNPLTGKVTRKFGRVDPDRYFGKPEDEEEEN